jgi:hypothetical protein
VTPADQVIASPCLESLASCASIPPLVALRWHRMSDQPDLGRVAGRITVAAAAVFRSVRCMIYIICERLRAAVTAIVPTPNDGSRHDSRPPGFRSPRGHRLSAAPAQLTQAPRSPTCFLQLSTPLVAAGPENSTAMM